jgi:pyruvyltransferase
MEKLNLAWWTGKNGKNFGDALNPIIAKFISNKEINHIPLKDSSKTFRYYMIGSILQFIYSDNTIIWGSGFMGEASEMNVKPKKISAVRGKLTREKLIKKGYECPEIYGDPALLYPIFYNPKIEKKYKIGIMPHYVDNDNAWINSFKNDKNIIIINTLDDVNKIIDNILSCDCIISSSLHGIIAADAYNIPSLWVEFSDKIGGNGFKFRDYFTSVDRYDKSPIKIDINTKLSDIMNKFYDYKIDIDLEKLYNSCPFK